MKKSILVGILCSFLVGMAGSLLGYSFPELYIKYSIRQAFSQCDYKEDSLPIACLRRKFAKIITRDNLSSSMKYIKHIVVDRRESFGKAGETQCHDIAHVVGEIVGASDGTVSPLLKGCSDTCGYGCAHGVIVGKLRSNPNAFSHLDTFCRQPGAAKADDIVCHHGIGHGLAEIKGYNFQAALGECEKFSTVESQDECASGVMMEIFDSPIEPLRAQGVPRDATELCFSSSGRFAERCIDFFAARTYEHTQNMIAALVLCEALSPVQKTSCVVSIGTDVYETKRSDAPKIVASCKEAGQERWSCIKGALYTSIVLDPTGGKGEALCNEFLGSEKLFCNALFEREMKVMTTRSTQ
jgi:hypothetical protein